MSRPSENEEYCYKGHKIVLDAEKDKCHYKIYDRQGKLVSKGWKKLKTNAKIESEKIVTKIYNKTHNYFRQ